jgi:hypothetical protein
MREIDFCPLPTIEGRDIAIMHTTEAIESTRNLSARAGGHEIPEESA